MLGAGVWLTTRGQSGRGRSEREWNRDEWEDDDIPIAASVSGEECTRWMEGDPGKMTLAGCEVKGVKWRDEGQGKPERGSREKKEKTRQDKQEEIWNNRDQS